MQIDMHKIKSHVPHLCHAHYRVEVRAVGIKKRPVAMKHVSDFCYIPVKEAQRIGAGEHHGRNGVIEQGFEPFYIHISFFC